MIYDQNIQKRLKSNYTALALFSGGLDSILAVKLIEEQGLDVLCIHFVSPFFGHPEKTSEWEKEYGLDILPIELGEEYIDIIKEPRYGYGKGLNPCIDCKIFMIKKAKKLLKVFKAKFLITGEVLGQRPMSQRKDTMNIILRDSGAKEILIRPLTAKNLVPTWAERENIIDRSFFLDLQGRSRKKQLELAKKFHIKKIPTPAGGCLLTDPELSKRFKMILKNLNSPKIHDFKLARLGRHFWKEEFWLTIGRNHKENTEMTKLIKENDLIFKLTNIPGPIGIGRSNNRKWPKDLIHGACSLITRYSKIRGQRQDVYVSVGEKGRVEQIKINPLHQGHNIWLPPI